MPELCLWLAYADEGVCAGVGADVRVQLLLRYEGDGVSIARCRNFSMGKFKNALVEIVLYLIIIEMVFTIMASCGDSKAALVTAKSMTYVFIYVYLQNSFKNLVKAYPRKMALRVIYHLLRFEFTRALPSYLKPIIERVEGEIEKAEQQTSDEKQADKEK